MECTWVVDIYSVNEKARFIRVQCRKQVKMQFLLEEYVGTSSAVWKNAFSAYNKYSMDDYCHQIVNPSKNFGDHL